MAKQAKDVTAEKTTEIIKHIQSARHTTGSTMGMFLNAILNDTVKAGQAKKVTLDALRSIPGGRVDADGWVRDIPLDEFEQVRIMNWVGGYIWRKELATGDAPVGDNVLAQAFAYFALPHAQRPAEDKGIYGAVRQEFTTMLKQAKVESPSPEAVKAREKKAQQLLADEALKEKIAAAVAGGQQGNDNASKLMQPDAEEKAARDAVNVVQFPAIKQPSFRVFELMYLAAIDKMASAFDGNADQVKGDVGSLMRDGITFMKANARAIRELEQKARDEAQAKAAADEAAAKAAAEAPKAEAPKAKAKKVG